MLLQNPGRADLKGNKFTVACVGRKQQEKVVAVLYILPMSFLEILACGQPGWRIGRTSDFLLAQAYCGDQESHQGSRNPLVLMRVTDENFQGHGVPPLETADHITT